MKKREEKGETLVIDICAGASSGRSAQGILAQAQQPTLARRASYVRNTTH